MLTAACFQFRSRVMDPQGNLRELERMLALPGKLPDVVVLPELFDVGYDLGALSGAHPDGTQSLEELRRIASSFGVALCAGILEIREGDLFNSLYFIDPEGGVAATYRKMCLFPLSREEAFFSPGDAPVIVDWKGFRFGLAVCFDLRFPELFRYYRKADCTAVLLGAAFPFPRLDHWRCLVQARAVENQYWVVACNRVGTDGALQFFGNSRIVDPWGVVRSSAGEDDHGLVTAELDVEAVHAARIKIPCDPGLEYLDRVLKQQDGAPKW